jgi:hypothetical protein
LREGASDSLLPVVKVGKVKKIDYGVIPHQINLTTKEKTSIFVVVIFLYFLNFSD